jgi:serine/threonine-protein kinase RsbW
MTAASLAGRLGMSFDEVDDVRIAVEEAYLFACADRKDDTELTFDFAIDDDGLVVTVGPLPGGADPDSSELKYTRFILEGVCDGFDVLEGDDADACFVRLTKRSAS